MAQNNLRVIYQNIASISTIFASSQQGGATAASNLQNTIKSYVYRSSTNSTTSVKANLVLEFPVQTFTKGVGLVLTNTNLTSVGTIRLRGFTGTAPTTGTGTNPTSTTPGTLVFDSGTVLASPYQSTGFSNWTDDSFNPPSALGTTYRDRHVYSRVWVPLNNSISCTSILVEITDTNINKYFEASSIIFGQYWSPKFNTSYGLSLSGKDTSTPFRTEAGDLLTNSGIIYNGLSFDIKWMYKDDRAILNKLLRSNGSKIPVFVSLFPDNSSDWEKEQLYQMYGKLTSIPNIEHNVYDMFSSQVELEEV